MTGWRLGWLVAPDDLDDPINRLNQNVAISAPSLAQIAAIAALSKDAEPELACRWSHSVPRLGGKRR